MEVSNYPQYINLELTARCNKSCSFCPTQQYLLYKKMGHSGHIDIELVKKVPDEIPKGTNVSFHKDGEVLLYPKLEEALDIMHHHFTHFCTNGVLLDKMASKLIGKVDLITYSVWDDETTSNVFETGEKSVIQFLEKLNKIIKPVADSTDQVVKLQDSLASMQEVLANTSASLQTLLNSANKASSSVNATTDAIDSSSLQLSKDISEVYSNLSEQIRSIRNR